MSQFQIAKISIGSRDQRICKNDIAFKTKENTRCNNVKPWLQ